MERLARALALAWSVAALGLVLAVAPATAAPELPSGFHESIVLSEAPRTDDDPLRARRPGLRREKSGEILVYSDLNDTEPEVFADLRTEVYDNGDRGLLGLALDPDFESNHLRLRPLHVRPHPWRSGAGRGNSALGHPEHER